MRKRIITLSVSFCICALTNLYMPYNSNKAYLNLLIRKNMFVGCIDVNGITCRVDVHRG